MAANYDNDLRNNIFRRYVDRVKNVKADVSLLKEYCNSILAKVTSGHAN